MLGGRRVRRIRRWRRVFPGSLTFGLVHPRLMRNVRQAFDEFFFGDHDRILASNRAL